MRFLVLFTLLFSFSALSKTVVVSDIDDTLKVSHVRDPKDLILNAFRTSNRFLGMSDLLHSLKKDNNAEIVYLTNAPKNLMEWSHSKLLFDGKFPRGTIYLRDGLSSDEHKVFTLRKIIKEKKPTRLILFGDNGEKDIYFYERIKNSFPNIEFTIFIRAAYDLDRDHTPLEGQYGFVSPFEVAWTLDKLGLIESHSIQILYNKHAIDFITEKRNLTTGPMYLPSWIKCKGFKVENYIDGIHNLDAYIMRKINKICKN